MATLRARLPKRVRRQVCHIAHCDAQTALQVCKQTLKRYTTMFSPTQSSPRPQSCASFFLRTFFPDCKELLSVDTIWPIHRRRRFYRPRLPQPACSKPHPPSSFPNHRRDLLHATRTDNRANHRKHIHVPPAAHPIRNAMARPILLPLPPKVGVLPQGKPLLSQRNI
jgi:hypothetical protein